MGRRRLNGYWLLPITMSRFIFGEEPIRVVGLLERDPDFGTDRLASAIMEFPSGQSIFTCSTQTAYFQRMHFLGTSGRVRNRNSVERAE